MRSTVFHETLRLSGVNSLLKSKLKSFTQYFPNPSVRYYENHWLPCSILSLAHQSLTLPQNRSSAKVSENDKHFCKQMKEETIDPTPSVSGWEEQSQQQLLANESPIWLLVSSTHTDSSRSAPFYGSHKGSSQNFPTTQENCQAELPATVSRRWLSTSKTISLDNTIAK